MGRVHDIISRSVTQNASAMILALLFWSVIVVLLIFCFALGLREGNPFMVFFTAFGAVGQVAFAAVVSWIAWEQFRHNRDVDERQFRVDTFERRLKIFEEFASLRRRFALSRFDETVAVEFAAISARMDLIFPKSVDHVATSLGERLFDLADVVEEYNDMDGAQGVDLDALNEVRKRRSAANKLVRESNSALYTELRNQLRLHYPSGEKGKSA